MKKGFKFLGTLLIASGLFFTSCEKEETTKHTIDCEEFKVERAENSCKSYMFTANVSGENPNPDWYVYTHPNPTPEHYGNNSNTFEFNPTAAGNYTVEAVYKSDLCDEAVTKGFDVDVNEECFKDEEVDCESFAVEKTQHDECGSFSFTTNVDNAYMKVNGELVKHGQKGFDFDPKEAGTYVVQVGFESEGCPQGVFKEFTIVVVEDCFR